MSAHESYPPDSPAKRRYVNVDITGVSLSWPTALAVLTTVASIVIATLGYAATLATKTDMTTHDVSESAHSAYRAKTSKLISSAVASVERKVDAVVISVAAADTTVKAVQDGFFDQRAEDVAYRVVDKLPQSTSPRQRIERFQSVKATVKRNLRDGLDARNGLAEVP